MFCSLWLSTFAWASTTLAAPAPCRQPSAPDCVEPWLDLTGLEGAANPWEDQWKEYKQQFGKTYVSPDEESMRKNIWVSKTFRIMNQNTNSSNTFSAGWNEFTDMTDAEFQSRLGYRPQKNSSKAWGLTYLGEHRFNGSMAGVPSSWDWSQAGHGGGISVVTRVKNQGQCGSCWSFSVTGALEGAHAIANGIDAGRISMSEQQLLDCSGSGCGGGSPSRAIEWEKGHNVCQEQSYPYKANSGTCRSQCTVILKKGSIWGHYSVGSTVGAACSALMQRPLSVVVAVNDAFQTYKSGILNNCPQAQTDHAILLVGWGYVYNKAYWKVKNSWGEVWGLSGFGLLARGIGGTDACSVLSGINGAYVYGPHNPRSQIYNNEGNLVLPDESLNEHGSVSTVPEISV